MQKKISRESVVKPASEQLSCDLAGEAVILNLQSGQYFGLNEIGSRVWSLIQEPRTIGDVFEILSQEYAVTPAQLEQDLFVLFKKMLLGGLIDVDNEKSS